MSGWDTTRFERARQIATEQGLDALLVTPGADLRYLTGYHALPLERLTCLVVPASGEPTLVVPRLEKAAAAAAGVTVPIAAWDETDDPFEVVAGLIGDGAHRIGVDDHMWAARVFAVRDALPNAEIVLGGAVVQQLRIVKDQHEAAALREAGAAIDRVHARVGEWLRPGRTEREVGADIEKAILEEHATCDFVIVGSGPNGASPHHEVSDRVIERGDPVVVDIGGTMPSGYCSDCTRTYVAGGEPPAEFLAQYEVLLAAQTAQREHARPGVTAESVDRVGRDIIAAAGYGDLFIHRTGHGIGQETHEEPYIVSGNQLPLQEGMAFSIEPGIYLEGRFGARIEDIVICTADGIEALNNVPRELVVLDRD